MKDNNVCGNYVKRFKGLVATLKIKTKRTYKRIPLSNWGFILMGLFTIINRLIGTHETPPVIFLSWVVMTMIWCFLAGMYHVDREKLNEH